MVSDNDIGKTISGLSVSAASVDDVFSVRTRRACLLAAIPIIKPIVDLSIISKVVRGKWKHASINPIITTGC